MLKMSPVVPPIAEARERDAAVEDVRLRGRGHGQDGARRERGECARPHGNPLGVWRMELLPERVR